MLPSRFYTLTNIAAVTDPVPVANGGSGVTTAALAAGVYLVDSAVVLGTTTGCQFGTAANQKSAFHGVTPCVQRDSSGIPAVATTGATVTLPYGFTEAQANGIIALVNECRAALVQKGLIKGS
jgi:hypothetical protein